MRAGNRFTGNADLALVVAEKAADHIEQSRFAAAGRADYREKFAGPDSERHVIDRGDRPVGCLEAHIDIVDHEDGVAGPRLGRCTVCWRRNGHGALFAFARHHGGHGRSVARLDTYIDNSDVAVLDRGDGLRENLVEIPHRRNRPETLRTLRARHLGDIDIGFRNALADPAVLDWAVAHAGDAFLM